MAKIDLDALSIEELATLRERVTEKLGEKVAARQTELEAELERLTQYGTKPAKKPPAAAVAPRAKKSERNVETEPASQQAEGPVAEAA
jgi:hypothetical protein